MAVQRLLPLRTLPVRTAHRLRFQARLYRPFPGLVDFSIAGFERCGTTTLDDYLREHPQIGMGSRKEVHFFDSDALFAAEDPDYRLYHRYFDGSPRLAVRGDATPVYGTWPGAYKRMQRYNPAMRLILLMRNPIDRAYSDWNMSRLNGGEPLSFSEAIRAPQETLRTGLPAYRRKTDSPWFGYAQRGLYAKQLEHLWQYFPRQQTLALKAEKMYRDHQETFDLVCAFLDVSPHRLSAPRRLNSREYAESIGAEDRSYLLSMFEADTSALESLLGWDCSDWRS